MDYVYTNKAKVARNPAVMHLIYSQYVRTGLTLNYTTGCIMHALIGSR